MVSKVLPYHFYFYIILEIFNIANTITFILINKIYETIENMSMIHETITVI